MYTAILGVYISYGAFASAVSLFLFVLVNLEFLAGRPLFCNSSLINICLCVVIFVSVLCDEWN